MSQINVLKLQQSITDVSEVIAVFDKEKIPFHYLPYHNWSSEYPYQPTVGFRMAHSGSALYIHYRVKEDYVRAMAGADNGRVWEDSCCEFFFSPECNQYYYNLETNCIGTVLFNYGIPGKREHATDEALNKIVRWSSLGSTSFDISPAPPIWDLCLIVPIEALYAHSLTSWQGLEIHGSVYKCGDKLPSPHFASLNKIPLSKPNFHCPEHFISFKFE